MPFSLWENPGRPHFKPFIKPCVFSIFAFVRLSPPLILWSLPQLSWRPSHALSSTSPANPSFSAARGVLAQQKSNLIIVLPKHFMASQSLRIRANPGPADLSVLSTHACPSHATCRALNYFHFLGPAVLSSVPRSVVLPLDSPLPTLQLAGSHCEFNNTGAPSPILRSSA